MATMRRNPRATTNYNYPDGAPRANEEGGGAELLRVILSVRPQPPSDLVVSKEDENDGKLKGASRRTHVPPQLLNRRDTDGPRRGGARRGGVAYSIAATPTRHDGEEGKGENSSLQNCSLYGRADRIRTVSGNQTKTMNPTRQSHNATITDQKKSSGPFFIQWPQNPCANKPQNTHVSYSISVFYWFLKTSPDILPTHPI